MPKWLLLALAHATLQAAVIRGVVVEHQTGKPLARVLLVAQPVAGTPGASLSVRTNPAGAFEFPSLAPGAYLLSASKRSFAPLLYGQKHFKAAGVPIILDAASAPFLNLRLQHFGSVTGAVVDENDVGLPDYDVAVYRNSHPPKLVARGQTDERGIYRIGGLDPGSYVVRTLAKEYDDGGYLPTFSKQTTRLDEAQTAEVRLDQQVENANVRPFPGRLFPVAGQAITFPQSQVTLTLVSDAGSETAVSDTAGNFKFNPQAPGSYELYALAQGNERKGGGAIAAGFRTLQVDGGRTDYRINLTALPEIRLLLEDIKGQPLDPRNLQLQLVARRKDLSGDANPEAVPISLAPLKLSPGRWDLALAPSSAYYAAGFFGPSMEGAPRGRADGWNEIVISGASPQETVKFALSSSPATVHGVVTNAAHDPVAGVPVFLEAYDTESKKRLMDVRATRTDTRGQYQFAGLAPGKYRILSSFEFQMPEQFNMDAANAPIITVEEGRDTSSDLNLYVIP